MARNHPPLKLRRGTEAAILAANVSDFEVGEPIFAQDTGKLFIKTTAGTLEEISGTAEAAATWGQITGTLTNQTDLQAALDLKVDLDDLPQDANGVIDIARESSLQDFIDAFPVDANGNLDIAEQTTLIQYGNSLNTLQTLVAGMQYLSTYFTNAALPDIPSTTGFLKYDATASAWSLVTSTATAPTEINGGNASSFSE